MKLTGLFGLTCSTLGLVLISSVANAQSLYGTFGFIPIGTLTANNSDLSLATSVVVPAVELVNTIPPTYFGRSNGFAPGQPYDLGLSTAVTLSTTTISNGGSLGISFVAHGTTFTFTPTSTVTLVGSVNGGGNFLTFAEFGTLTDGPSFTAQQSEVAASFSQSAVGATVNANFTFSTPPQDTPEPGSFALFLGVGVTGIGFMARRRKQ